MHTPGNICRLQDQLKQAVGHASLSDVTPRSPWERRFQDAVPSINHHFSAIPNLSHRFTAQGESQIPYLPQFYMLPNVCALIYVPLVIMRPWALRAPSGRNYSFDQHNLFFCAITMNFVTKLCTHTRYIPAIL